MRYFNATIVDDAGEIQPGSTVEVRREIDNALVPLFDINNVAMANPFAVGADAFAQFRTNENGYFRITAQLPSLDTFIWRQVPLFIYVNNEDDNILDGDLDVTGTISGIGTVPIGTSLLWDSETLPGAGEWQWREGGSLVRANYTVLRDLYIVSRGVVTITEANPGVVTLAAHGFGTASCISLATTGTLPTNLAINTNYYVIYVNANTFRLATTADLARAGTAIDTSGAIMAGVHTLYSNPHGINGANSFYLPDGDGLVMKQTGDLTINGRTKTGVGLGAAEEDQHQKITGSWTNTTYSVSWSPVDMTPAGAFSNSGTNRNRSGALDGGASVTNGFTFDSANSPSARASSATVGETRVNDMGVKYIVRVI